MTLTSITPLHKGQSAGSQTNFPEFDDTGTIIDEIPIPKTRGFAQVRWTGTVLGESKLGAAIAVKDKVKVRLLVDGQPVLRPFGATVGPSDEVSITASWPLSRIASIKKLSVQLSCLLTTGVRAMTVVCSQMEVDIHG